MSKVPKNLQNDSISEYLLKNNYVRIHQGKVRDTYFIDEEQLLLVASDRISIFDFVLNALVRYKGSVLTALTHFWLTEVLSSFSHHLVKSVHKFKVNAAYDLKMMGLIPELPLNRCLVVKNLTGKVSPFEMIYRHHIGGSVFNKYQATGKAGGHILPAGLPKWSKLEKPIFTPSTKEEVGHDVNVDADYYFAEMEKLGVGEMAHEVVALLGEAYSIAYAYAEKRGILILDTKMEVAGATIVDEIITPDSSRFAVKNDWEKAMGEGHDPQFYDKEPVRNWGRTITTPFLKGEKPIIGINNLNPENPFHVEFVHSLEVPEEIVKDTSDRYLKIFEMITGVDLFQYQVEVMKCS